MFKKLLTFILLVAPTCFAQRTTLPPGGGSTAPINVVNTSSAAFAGGAKHDAHFISDPTFTNASNIVTCPNSDCSFTGTDFQGRAIAKVGQIVFGSNATTDVSQTTSTIITPECVIQSIDNANQIHMGQIGSPAAACNATSTLTATGYLIWGDLDTASSTQTQSTANDPLFAAWQQVVANCGLQYQMPAGATLVERGEWNNGPSFLCNSGPFVQLTRQGFTMQGAGKASTILIMTPNFVAADCNPGCFGQGIPNPNIQNFQIWGAGNSTPGAAFNNKSIFYVLGNTTNGGSNFSIRSVIMQGFGAQQTGMIGIDIGHNVAGAISGGLISDSICEAFGAICVKNQPGNTTEMTEVTNDQFTGCGIGPNGGCVTNLQGQWSSSNSFYGWSPTSFTNENAFECDNGLCKFDGDYFPYQVGTGTAQLTASGGGVVRLSQTFINAPNAGAFGVSYSGSTAQIFASQTTITAATAVDAINVSGTPAFFDDLGGNVIGGLTGTGTLVWAGPGDGNIIRAGCTGTVTASLTTGGMYGTGPNKTATACNAETAPGAPGSGIRMTKAGTIIGMFVTATNAGVNASSGAFTVLKAGAATANTCTVGTGTSCKDFTHTVAVAVGDLISFQYTTQAADTLAGLSVTVVIN